MQFSPVGLRLLCYNIIEYYEASESINELVNSILDIIGVNSLRLGRLHLTKAI